MIMEKPGADFSPLIAALIEASANPEATLSEQLGIIELSLVSAELNPNRVESVELFYSLKALREIDLNRGEIEASQDLERFFESH